MVFVEPVIRLEAIQDGLEVGLGAILETASNSRVKTHTEVRSTPVAP